MLKGTKKYWLIAIICGLVAVLLSYQYMQDIKSRYSPDDLVKVVKARQAINKDNLITSAQVELENVPSKYVHPDSVRNLDRVVGKTAITNIAAGEQILKERLVSDDEKKQRLAYSIPENMRAVSIPIDSTSGVSGYVKAGDRVDIAATVDIPVSSEAGGTAIAVTSITLQDIEVLAVGNNPDSTAKKAEEEAKTLTLAVSIKDAPPLILASERGNLRLMLRPPVDKSKTSVAPYKLNDFMTNPIPQM